MSKQAFAAAPLLLAVLCFGPGAAAQKAPTPATNPAYCPPGTNPSAQGPPEGPVAAEVLKESVPPQAGEICLICNEPVSSSDTAYLIDGQRVPIHQGACLAKLQANPGPYLAQLQPHGAFLGSQGGTARLSYGWFVVGLFILAGLIFGALCAHRALHTGHSPLAWFAAGFVLNVVAYLVLLTRPRQVIAAPAGVPAGLRKIPLTYRPRLCPHCGSANHPSADRCLSCGAPLEPSQVSEVVKAGLAHER